MSHTPAPHEPGGQPPPSRSPDSTPTGEQLRMTPWLWLLGGAAILIGILCGFVMSVASLRK